MALYRLTVFKRHNAWPRGWTNVYTVSATGAGDALLVGVSVRAAEIAVHYSDTEFYRMSVVNLANPADRSAVNATFFGDLDPATLGGILPLFNTVRCVFSDGVRRPESKYLRLPGNEDNLENGQWSTELTDYIDTNYVGVITNDIGVVGPSGEPLTGGSTSRVVQNRQLGWHRRTRPGFRRGWVPV